MCVVMVRKSLKLNKQNSTVLFALFKRVLIANNVYPFHNSFFLWVDNDRRKVNMAVRIFFRRNLRPHIEKIFYMISREVS